MSNEINLDLLGDEPVIPIVTKQQMIDYCFAQPDDRIVNFGENYNNTHCGCVMVQYGKTNGLDFAGCGFQYWEKDDGYKVARLEGNITFSQFQPSDNDECTYGDIKKHLIEKGWLPTKGTNDA